LLQPQASGGDHLAGEMGIGIDALHENHFVGHALKCTIAQAEREMGRTVTDVFSDGGIKGRTHVA